MISSEVQRTLVKSPPELWSELSDPVALARHLGDLGEIRITRIEPERKVEWEAEHTSGTVLIKPSGWGTKVILTVAARSAEAGLTPAPPTLEAQPDPAADTTASPPLPAQAPAAGPEPAVEPEPALELELQVEPEQAFELEPQPELGLEDEPDWEPAPESHGDPEPEPQLQGRRGFLARLLRRRRELPAAVPQPTAESSAVRSRPPWRARIAAMGQRAQFALELDEPEPSHEPAERGPTPETIEPPQPAHAQAQAMDTHADVRAQALQPSEPDPEPHLEPGPEPNPDRDPVKHIVDVSAEIRAAEEVAAEEVAAEHVTAVLTSVLDRLGAAHHRPFSRA
jgi:hypothetical protein